MQRRVQVAQAFLHDPEMLFLDEPTVGLDPLARRDTLDLIKAKVKEGMTVFYTTHVLDEVDYLCDRVVVLVKGKIAVLDTPGNLRRKYGGHKTLDLHLGHSSENAVSNFMEELTYHGKTNTNVSLVKPELDSSLITLHVENSGEIVSEILSIASKLGVTIISLTMKEPSLDDAFIEILKKTKTVQ